MRHRFMIALLGLLLAGTAGAATFNVPSPYSTIQDAINAASHGDTVLVGNGTYNENVTVNKNIILLSVNGRNVTHIVGNAAGPEQGTIYITPGSNGVRIGEVGHGFKITGLDGPPTSERSAIYLQQNHTNMVIQGNEIYANGDEGLLTEYNQAVTYITIDQNIFSGQAFNLPTPGGDGFGGQWTVPNTPRQLVVIGSGPGYTNTHHITFTNNLINGVAGGLNSANVEQGNNLVTIDADNSTIDNNTFNGTTTRGAASIRCRRPLDSFSGNTFTSTNLSPTCSQFLLVNNTVTPAFITGNTFDKGVYVVGGDRVGLNIQAFVGVVPASTTVNILAGIYTEQIHITTSSLQLVGAGVDQTIIKSPASCPLYFTTPGNDNHPVVFVDGATGVGISYLTVDGDLKGNANYRFQGIGFWNSGGSMRHAKVINVMDNPFSGNQHGVGIYAYNNIGGPYTIALDDVLVDDFQKTAVVLLGTLLSVDLDGVTIVGAGPTSVTAQNGIQIGYGASGTVDDCTISDIAYTGADWTATGFLGYQAGTVVADGVDIAGCQTSVYWQDSGGSFNDLNITSPRGDAFYAYSSGAKAEGLATRPSAQPVVEDAPARDKSAVNVSVTNSVVTGTEATGSWGLAAWGYGPINFTVTGCAVTGWDYGILAINYGGASINLAAHQNALAPNGAYGLYSNASETAAASCNWWGDITGPNAPPANLGTGEALAGNAVFWPWLDAPNGNCDEYGPNNVAVVSPLPGNCLTPTNTCETLTVAFNRTDTTPLRLISVDIQLSPELALCTGVPGVDIMAGGLWGAFGITKQIYNTGPGSYTVDISVLSDPCGPTTGGDVFTVNVKASGVPGTSGTLTVTAVTVRDCDNVPLPGGPGAPGTIGIDLTAPASVTSLATAQVKNGNDTNGTTKITVSWTASTSLDDDYVQIWRKGYGQYPEYNDAGGAVPTGPITVANGWTLAATVDDAIVSYVDEPSTRDFWYYAAIVFDACGNPSAASSITGGTLNYHLGDVTDGTTNGTGDNAVYTQDISLLGNHYGITLPPDTYNYLDVGPTTDYSVNARPETDNRIQFEDLIMFAINYNLVSKETLPNLTPAAEGAVIAKVGEVDPATSTLTVEIAMSGDGRIQGLSVPLTWNGDVVQPAGFTAGSLIADQGGLGMVLSPAPGTVDAAIFGVRDQGICGLGNVATVTFQVVGAGDPGIALGEITARDNENQQVTVSGSLAQPGVPTPVRTELYANTPNPFNPSTELSFALSHQSNVRLQIYSVQGRLVATLVDGELPAGPHHVTWQGRDDSGRMVSSGAYIVRLEAPDATQSRRITLMK